MKCKSKPLFIGRDESPVTNVWEILLDMSIWQKIQEIAKRRNLTYSWIVRLCLFEYCRKIGQANQAERISEDKRTNSPGRHRFRLCLYGEDEKIIRMVAFENNLSVSGLVRLAIEAKLPEMERGNFSDQFIFEFGIKLSRNGYFEQAEVHLRPSLSRYRWLGFSPTEWWPCRHLRHTMHFIYRIRRFNPAKTKHILQIVST